MVVESADAAVKGCYAMDTREPRLIDSVESLQPEIMRFARDLVAQASTLGNEAGALEVMSAELETLGRTRT
jgi:hypothetical protein